MKILRKLKLTWELLPLTSLPDLGLGHKASLTLGEEWAILDSGYSKKKSSLSDEDKWVSPNQKDWRLSESNCAHLAFKRMALCGVSFWFGEKE